MEDAWAGRCQHLGFLPHLSEEKNKLLPSPGPSEGPRPKVTGKRKGRGASSPQSSTNSIGPIQGLAGTVRPRQVPQPNRLSLYSCRTYSQLVAREVPLSWKSSAREVLHLGNPTFKPPAAQWRSLLLKAGRWGMPRERPHLPCGDGELPCSFNVVWFFFSLKNCGCFRKKGLNWESSSK